MVSGPDLGVGGGDNGTVQHVAGIEDEGHQDMVVEQEVIYWHLADI